jgi:hypothetical protein
MCLVPSCFPTAHFFAFLQVMMNRPSFVGRWIKVMNPLIIHCSVPRCHPPLLFMYMHSLFRFLRLEVPTAVTGRQHRVVRRDPTCQHASAVLCLVLLFLALYLRWSSSETTGYLRKPAYFNPESNFLPLSVALKYSACLLFHKYDRPRIKSVLLCLILK